MCKNRPKLAVPGKRRGKLSQDVLLLHDDNHPHSAAHNKKTLRNKFEALVPASYSPDLKTFDFHQFDPLKLALRDHHLQMMTKCRMQPMTACILKQKFSFDGIRKLWVSEISVQSSRETMQKSVNTAKIQSK